MAKFYVFMDLHAFPFSTVLLSFLFLSTIIWALIWKYEARYYKNRSEKLDILRGFYIESLEELEVPLAYFDDQHHPYVNNLFLKIWNLKADDDLKAGIIEVLSPSLAIETWDDFLRYLQFQCRDFTHVLPHEDQHYCVYARALDNVIFIWMSQLEEEKNKAPILNRILDALPVAAWYRDHNKKIIYHNKAYETLLEDEYQSFTQEETKAIPKNMEFISKEKSLSPYQQSLHAVKKQKTHVNRFYTTIHGERRFIEMASVPCFQEDSIGYVMDVSEFDDLEKEFKRYHLGHNDLLEHLHTGITIYDSSSKLVFFNQTYVKLFDLDEDWLKTSPTVIDILDNLRSRRKLQEYNDFPAYKKGCQELFKNVFEPYQDILYQPDGRILRMFVAPYKAGGVFCLFDDVTKKMTLENRHRMLLEVQKETIDHLFEGVLIFGADNKLQVLNKAFSRFFAIKQPETFLGKNMNECFDLNLLPKDMAWDIDAQDFTELFAKRVPIYKKLMRCKAGVFAHTYAPLPDGSHLLTFSRMLEESGASKAVKERLQKKIDGAAA